MLIIFDTWLKKHRLSRYEFAKRYRISQPYVSQIINQKKKPSKAMSEYIDKITNGEVSKKYLRPDLYGLTRHVSK